MNILLEVKIIEGLDGKLLSGIHIFPVGGVKRELLPAIVEELKKATDCMEKYLKEQQDGISQPG